MLLHKFHNEIIHRPKDVVCYLASRSRVKTNRLVFKRLGVLIQILFHEPNKAWITSDLSRTKSINGRLLDLSDKGTLLELVKLLVLLERAGKDNLCFFTTDLLRCFKTVVGLTSETNLGLTYTITEDQALTYFDFTLMGKNTSFVITC